MNDLMLVKVTNTIDEIASPQTQRDRTFRHAESASSGEARIDFEVEGKISLTCPRTWTYDEFKKELDNLSAKLARAQCFLIIQSLPSEVVPVLLPQLKEIAEYEARIMNFRKEILRPQVPDRVVFLPIEK